MIKAILSICAERVIVDAESNNVSIINIIEEVSAQGFPLSIPNLNLLYQLEKEEGDTENEFSLTGSLNSTEMHRFPVQVDFKNQLKSRVIVNLVGYPISAEGVHKFSLLKSGQEIGVCSFKVNVAKLAEPQITIQTT